MEGGGIMRMLPLVSLFVYLVTTGLVKSADPTNILEETSSTFSQEHLAWEGEGPVAELAAEPAGEPIAEDVARMVAVTEFGGRLANASSTQPSVDNFGVGKNGVWQLTLLHFNDFHNRIEPSDQGGTICDDWRVSQGHCIGGVARMKAVVDSERSRNPELVLLNAGDDLVGTAWDRFYGKTVPAFFLKMLRPDAMTVGNHEFDWGPDNLARYLQQLPYPALSCNADFHGHWLKDEIRCYTTKYVRGRKVCIFGLTTEVTQTWSHSYPVTFSSAFDAGQKTANMLHDNEKCHAIILLSHLGYTADIVAAQRMPHVNIIVGGHSHSFLCSGGPPSYDRDSNGQPLSDIKWGEYPTWVTNSATGQRVAVVQAGWGSRYIGKLTAEFNDVGDMLDARGAPIVLASRLGDNPVEPDGYVVQQVKNAHYW